VQALMEDALCPIRPPLILLLDIPEELRKFLVTPLRILDVLVVRFGTLQGMIKDAD
jgi:hypothetical protein